MSRRSEIGNPLFSFYSERYFYLGLRRLIGFNNDVAGDHRPGRQLGFVKRSRYFEFLPGFDFSYGVIQQAFGIADLQDLQVGIGLVPLQVARQR